MKGTQNKTSVLMHRITDDVPSVSSFIGVIKPFQMWNFMITLRKYSIEQLKSNVCYRMFFKIFALDCYSRTSVEKQKLVMF